jgi:hypothetical protein
MALAQQPRRVAATGMRRGALTGAGLAAFLTVAHLATDAFTSLP